MEMFEDPPLMSINRVLVKSMAMKVRQVGPLVDVNPASTKGMNVKLKRFEKPSVIPVTLTNG